MTITETTVDSSSVGDPARFLTFGQLEQKLEGLPRAPADVGRVQLVVRRGSDGRRETPPRIELSAEGVEGDAWGRRTEKNPDMQIAVVQADVAAIIANGQPLTLFGDSLFLELDLSTTNLPSGSRVRVGPAILVVTPMPHNGCRKFQARFGAEALRFVSGKPLRDRNLRGIYMRVLEPGTVAPGDAVSVLSRNAA